MSGSKEPGQYTEPTDRGETLGVHEFLILTGCEKNKVGRVAASLSEIDGLQTGHTVYGSVDIVSRFSSDTPLGMSQTILRGVNPIAGVVDTKLLYILQEAFDESVLATRKIPFYIFVNADRLRRLCEGDKLINELVEQFSGIEGVVSAYGFSGGFDAAVFGSVDTSEELAQNVLREVHSIGGLQRTETMICTSEIVPLAN